MRFDPAGTWNAPAADLAAGAVRHLYIESAAPDDMQARVAAALAPFVPVTQDEEWLITHVDLSGGGDGHTFVTHLELANINASQNIDATGVAPGAARILYYMAAQAAALLPARRALQAQIAALFAGNGGPFTSVTLLQTGFAGASQGTPFMGMLLLVGIAIT